MLKTDRVGLIARADRNVAIAQAEDRGELASPGGESDNGPPATRTAAVPRRDLAEKR